MTGETILEEAQRLTSGARQVAYGRPIDNYQLLADLVNAYLGPKLTEPLTPEDVAMVMVLVKVARERHRPHRDNRTDGAGYFQVIELIHQQRGQRQTNAAGRADPD